MSQKQSKPLKVSKISVLRKMIGLDKKKPAKDYVVPNNSVQNMQKPGFYDPSINATDTQLSGVMSHKCPYCENLAKNFLYMESLIRNNTESAHKCSVCNASLKYLEHVNRNVRQVFGNFESIAKADRALNATPPMLPKYSVTPIAQRATGGAVLAPQKSLKTLKRSKSKTKPVKKQKSSKSLKSLKSMKSLKTIKSGKQLHKALKSSKSGKNLGKSRHQLKTGGASQAGRGKLVLKRKYRKTAIKPPGSKMSSGMSQYRGLAAGRSKMAASRSKIAASRSKMSASRSKMAASRSKLGHKGDNKQKKLSKKRSEGVPTSINWKLLKKNLPKRIPLIS